jgi:hypothetical protein
MTDKVAAIERLIACADVGIVEINDLCKIKRDARAELAAVREREAKWRELLEAAKDLCEACLTADAAEELSEIVDGSFLDAIRDAIATCTKMGGSE